MSEKVKMKIWFAGVPRGGWTKSEKTLNRL